jgi:stage II sporulation protein AA (anti-sigma F factor antagonist)
MSTAEQDQATLAFDRTVPGCAVARFHGDLDACAASRLEDQLMNALEPGLARLVLDLSDVGFIDSSGIRLLMQAVARLNGPEGVSVVNARPGVARRALEIVGLSRVLRVEETLDAALRPAAGANHH